MSLYPAQMRLTKNDDMIQALAADRPDQPFGKAILPQRGWCGRFVQDAHGAHSACDGGTIDAIPIADEVFWGFIPKKRLGHLTRNPIRCRVCSDIDPGEVSAVESQWSGAWLHRNVRHMWFGLKILCEAAAFIDGQFVVRDSVLPWSAGNGSSHKCLAPLECAPISRTIAEQRQR